MLPAWQAAAGSPQVSDAFIAVLHGDDPDVRNNWAESYLREDGWGNPWIAYGFGLPADAQVVQHPAEATADPGWQGSLLSRSNTVLDCRLELRRGSDDLDVTGSRASTTTATTVLSRSRTRASARRTAVACVRPEQRSPARTWPSRS